MPIPTRPVQGESILSVWGDNVHDRVFRDIQSGSIVVPIAGVSYAIAVTFPIPFLVPPVVVVSIDNAVAIDLVGKISAGAITATAFTGIVSSVTNTARTGNVRLYWAAFGPMP